MNRNISLIGLLSIMIFTFLSVNSNSAIYSPKMDPHPAYTIVDNNTIPLSPILTRTHSNETGNYVIPSSESLNTSLYTIVNTTDQSGNYKGSETFSSYANGTNPWDSYSGGFVKTWHYIADSYLGHNKVYLDPATTTSNRGVKKQMSYTFGSANVSFQCWVVVLNFTSGAIYWDLESSTGKYARLYYNSGDWVMDCDGSSTTVKTMATCGLSNGTWFTLEFELSPSTTKWSLLINGNYWGTKTLTLNNVDFFGWITTGSYAKGNAIDSPSWTWSTPTYVLDDFLSLIAGTSTFAYSFNAGFTLTTLDHVRNLTIGYYLQSNVSTQFNSSVYNYVTGANETLLSNCSTGPNYFTTEISVRTQNYLNSSLNFSIGFVSTNTTIFTVNLTVIVLLEYYVDNVVSIYPLISLWTQSSHLINTVNNISVEVVSIHPIHTINYWSNLTGNVSISNMSTIFSQTVCNATSQYYTVMVFVNDSYNNWAQVNVSRLFIHANLLDLTLTLETTNALSNSEILFIVIVALNVVVLLIWRRNKWLAGLFLILVLWNGIYALTQTGVNVTFIVSLMAFATLLNAMQIEYLVRGRLSNGK